MSRPLVSVLCLCFNHEKFVKKAIESVLQQTYENIEILIIDDASTDGSWKQIVQLKQQYPQVIVERNETNLGNCKSFNLLLAKAKGKYVIDLATDDVLMMERVAAQVDFFERQPPTVGVIYSNAQYINEDGEPLKVHFPETVKNPVSGEVFAALLSRYIICPPTMMIKKEVLDELRGYDEALAYEDFDFWIRSSKKWEYQYQNEGLTQKRVVYNSLSTKFETIQKMNDSTYLVCEKAALLVQSKEEHKALGKRLNYELREALKRKDNKNQLRYLELMRRNKVSLDWKTFLRKMKIRVR